MWKILKKILRTIALWLPLCCMIVNTYALDDIETLPLHPYISISWSSDSSTQGSVLAYDSLPKPITGSSDSNKYRGVMVYQSALKKDTFYHIRFKMNASNAASRTWLDNISTGVITDAGGQAHTVMLPANRLAPYSSSIEESFTSGSYKPIMMSWESMMANDIKSYVGAKVYYYFTRENNNDFTVDAIMYFNDEFFNYGWNYDASSTRYMQCYLGIFMPMVGGIFLTETSIYEVGGSDYNGKLDRIISLLQAQGGGLSKEDIEAATLAALQQHDAAEQQQGNAAINDAQNQLNNAFNPYLQNLTAIKDSFNGFTTALSYSGTSCVITLPAAVNPMTNTELWSAQNIDLGYYYNQIPQALRTLIRASLSALIFYSVILEVIDTIRRITGVSDND